MNVWQQKNFHSKCKNVHLHSELPFLLDRNMLNIGFWIGQDDSRDPRLQLRLFFSPSSNQSQKHMHTPNDEINSLVCYSPWAGRTGARRCWAPREARARSKSWTPAGADFCVTSASCRALSCKPWIPASRRTAINMLNLNWQRQVAAPGSELRESLPGFVWACSSPLLELDIRPCNATDGLETKRNWLKDATSHTQQKIKGSGITEQLQENNFLNTFRCM